ncbi:uncharacterized protein LOC119108464 [Pollicipes pollicipes]|uniref:uncharacterized protein LOC119108464 n=1 Tax=Pollicipes pollicipes TaxID=41117 RepID=UPI0018859882|nr:uncharacterized protein LOC119108464 [Pollicipes pollicipes]
MVDRFLPTGHKLPPTSPARGQRVNVRETHNPGLAVIIHVLGHLVPLVPRALDPVPPRHVQLGACASLLRQVAQTGSTRDALLLSNLERTEQFPFLLYYTVDKQRGNAPDTYSAIVRTMQETFCRLEASYVADHTIRLYDEVATIARPPLTDQRRPTSAQTGYIVSIFRVMEGDDRRSFERDWLSWTGARLLYRSIPASAGLRRMVLHKACGDGDIYYVLTCECSSLLDNVVASARALPALRARLVGYTGIYKLMAVS